MPAFRDVRWRLHLAALPSRVYGFLATDAGRARYGASGTDLDFTERDVPAEVCAQNHAGWLSVLLALKAACDFGVDLRNHDPARSWDQGYVDN